MTSIKHRTVLWFQVFGLAVLQGAITLTWVVYNLYLPKLLGQFGFPKEFAIWLLVVENMLAIALEPLMGALSDRARHDLISRYTLITAGVVLSSALFIGIPTIALFGNGWIMIALMILWSITMAMFRSPALALIGQYASLTKLPQAISVVTSMGVLVSAIALFPIQPFLLSLPPIMPFAIASVGLVAAATVLLKLDAQVFNVDDAKQPIILRNLGLILLLGLGIGVGSSLTRKMLSPQPLDSLIFTGSHLLTLMPAGVIATKFGNRRTMIAGIGIILGCLPLLNWVSLVGLGTGFSLAANGAIPFSLAMSTRAGLAIGCYFGGMSLANSLVGILSATVAIPSSLMSAIAFTLAGLAVIMSVLERNRASID
jgi:MFS family permease